VTENLYGWDDFDEAGLIINKRGDLKSYQEVIAVGDDVKWVKPGDVVEINYYKYCQFENDENSVKVNGSNKIVSIKLNEIELEIVLIGGSGGLEFIDFLLILEEDVARKPVFSVGGHIAAFFVFALDRRPPYAELPSGRFFDMEMDDGIRAKCVEEVSV
jgi:hypothetical protein